MQGEFKQCPNGHYYQGASCPYCKTGNQTGHATSQKTEVFVGDEDNQTKTFDLYRGDCGEGTKTTVVD